jgi:D-lactate dehydrogenase
VLSIHAALLPETHHLIDERAFARMKAGVILINTARGPIVDSRALCEALDAGKVAAAGLDVFEGEELIKDEIARLRTPLTQAQLAQLATCHALLRRENVILTPHIAFLSVEGVRRLLETSLENIQRFLDGKPQNLVTGPATGH